MAGIANVGRVWVQQSTKLVTMVTKVGSRKAFVTFVTGFIRFDNSAFRRQTYMVVHYSFRSAKIGSNPAAREAGITGAKRAAMQSSECQPNWIPRLNTEQLIGN